MLNRRQLFRHATYLMGGALAAPAALSLLHGCASEDRRTFTPKYFTPEEAAFVTAYVDTLLPRTDTPGGLDVNVDIFIDKVMHVNSQTADAPERRGEPSEMQLGIRAFDEDSRASFNRAFAELDAAERGTLFERAEANDNPYSPRVWGVPVGEQLPIGFYRSFKSFVLWGYLSSEKIATEVLNYDPVPGEYDGDIPLASVGGRAWSL